MKIFITSSFKAARISYCLTWNLANNEQIFSIFSLNLSGLNIQPIVTFIFGYYLASKMGLSFIQSKPRRATRGNEAHIQETTPRPRCLNKISPINMRIIPIFLLAN